MLATIIPTRQPNTAGSKSTDPCSHEQAVEASLCDQLRQALASSGYCSLKRVTVAIRDGIVHLSGTVESWYLRQMAQEIVMGITGRGCLRNDLSVVYGKAK